VTPAWSEINSILENEIRAAMRGEKSVQEALDSVATQSDALLAKFN
jgi:ABC-type glycerol-3-phosphate transport system substrate-binding protein